jgi:hypothetical protein
VIPANAWGIVFFLVLVAPGLLDDLLFESRAARAAESTFREISRVVLVSLVFSAPPLLTLAIVGDRGGVSVLPDPSEWAARGDTYLVRSYVPIVVALIIQTATSCGLVWVWHRWSRRSTKPLIHKPAWTKVFRDDNPTDEPPEARVRLSSGTVFWGTVSDYTQTFNVADRELVLSPPLFTRKPGGTRTAMGERMARVVLKAEDIETIVVMYVDAPPSESEQSDRRSDVETETGT